MIKIVRVLECVCCRRAANTNVRVHVHNFIFLLFYETARAVSSVGVNVNQNTSESSTHRASAVISATVVVLLRRIGVYWLLHTLFRIFYYYFLSLVCAVYARCLWANIYSYTLHKQSLHWVQLGFIHLYIYFLHSLVESTTPSSLFWPIPLHRNIVSPTLAQSQHRNYITHIHTVPVIARNAIECETVACAVCQARPRTRYISWNLISISHKRIHTHTHQ